jgi:hypothetical protein
MAARLILHIGVQKSGSTYLQQMLQDRARELSATGVLYTLPTGKRAAKIRVNHHEVATYGLLGDEYPWVPPERVAGQRGWWRELRDQVRTWPGTAIVSAEALSVVRLEGARRIVEEFGIPGQTDVFITARGFGKLLPSAWQQQLRNGRATSFASYLRNFAGERDKGWDVLEKELQAEKWRAFALGRLARRWASIVGMERVTLITNPGSPPDLLWRRFLEAAELGATSGLPAPDPDTIVHGGVTAAEAEVLVSINARLLAANWAPSTVRRVGNRIVRAWSAREERGPRLGIPPDYREQVDRWSREDLADLRRAGPRVVGDLDELTYSADAEPPEPTAADIIAAAGIAGSTAAEWIPGPDDVRLAPGSTAGDDIEDRPADQ